MVLSKLVVFQRAKRTFKWFLEWDKLRISFLWPQNLFKNLRQALDLLLSETQVDINLPEVHCAPGVRRPEAAGHFCSDLAMAKWLLEGPCGLGPSPVLVFSKQSEVGWGTAGFPIRTLLSRLIKPWESSGTEPFNKHFGSACCLCLFVHGRLTVSRWELFTPCICVLSAEKTIGWSWLTAPPWRMCSIRSPFSSWEKAGRLRPLWVLGLGQLPL